MHEMGVGVKQTSLDCLIKKCKEKSTYKEQAYALLRQIEGESLRLRDQHGTGVLGGSDRFIYF